MLQILSVHFMRVSMCNVCELESMFFNFCVHMAHMYIDSRNPLTLINDHSSFEANNDI